MSEQRSRGLTRALTAEELQRLPCSFCAKTKAEVARLFVAPQGGIYICGDCVFLLHEILLEEGVTPSA